MEQKTLAERDNELIWHPYTQMKTAAMPVGIERGEGAHLFDESGKKYIDAVSSWWVTIHGHSHPHIAKRIYEQALKLEHVIFAGFTHRPATELAEKLIKKLPENQARIFYSDNGSTAVEVALKMCIQYWSNNGVTKKKVLAFKNSYHGDTFGAMAVSARSAFTKPFDDLLFEVAFIDLPTSSNIAQLKSYISYLRSELAAFIFEPLVQGTGGMLMYEAELLNELLEHCRKENVLTIADEVMTGFGRTGTFFASDQLSAKADIFCLSKGLTGGTMALGVTSCTKEIYEAFLSEDKLKTLFHGHSFTANPIACTAAQASLEIFENENTMAKVAQIGRLHEKFKAEIQDHPKLKEVRLTGTIIALEWKVATETSYFNNKRDVLYNFFMDSGILLRPLGNIIYIMPPYCISDTDLQTVYSKIKEALELI